MTPNHNVLVSLSVSKTRFWSVVNVCDWSKSEGNLVNLTVHIKSNPHWEDHQFHRNLSVGSTTHKYDSDVFRHDNKFFAAVGPLFKKCGKPQFRLMNVHFSNGLIFRLHWDTWSSILYSAVQRHECGRFSEKYPQLA